MKKNLLCSVIICMAALFILSSCKQENPPIPPHVAIRATYNAGDNTAPKKGRDSGALIVVMVKEGQRWSLEKSGDDISWITYEITSGNETTTIPCKIAENKTGAVRTVTLTATTDGLPPIKYDIAQKK